MTLNAQLLEAVNALITAIFVAMSFIVARYLWREMSSNGYRRLRARAAISLLAVFSGEGLKAGDLWWVRARHNAGLPPDVVAQYQDAIVLGGASVLLLGGLCYIRVWAPREWGEWPWLGTLAVAATFATAGLVAALCVWTFLGIVFWFWLRKRSPH